ncbi:MAG: hypothetical protein OXU51_13645 [Candidatus Poribacteria bacterium]|nr:hypothetical protein [Candidatus Poribacteria bacterium]
MRRFCFLACAFLLCLSSFVSAQPPIEVIYFKPSNVQEPSEEDIEFIREVMVEVQSFFASEMDRHGFGPKTFDFNTDIRVVDGRRNAEYYSDVDTVKNETHQIDFEVQNKTDVVFLPGRKRILGGALGAELPICWTWPGQPQDVNDCNHFVVIPTGYKEFLLPVTAHEIAHAFGLQHTLKKTTDSRVDIMYAKPTFYEGVKAELKDYAVSRPDAVLLDKGGRLSIQEEPQVLAQEIDADVNDDGYVDLYDVMIVRSGMQNSTSYDTDINNDGVTDENDLAIVKVKAMEAIIAASPRKRKVKITTWGNLKRK